MAKKKASTSSKSSVIATSAKNNTADDDGCIEQDDIFVNLQGWTLTKKINGRIVTATAFELSAEEKNSLKGKKHKVKHSVPGNGGTPSDSIDIPITKSGDQLFVDIEYRVQESKSKDPAFFGAGKLRITITPK